MNSGIRHSNSKFNRAQLRKMFSLKNKTADVTSITAISLLCYFVFTFITAKLVYLQFSFSEVIAVSLMFLAILTMIVVVFLKIEKPFQININVENLINATLLFFILVIYTISSSENIDWFLHPLILSESELHVWWNNDTAFHVSLIQSILNWGYPSIAQHGHPFSVYHVFSHYTDALILKIVGLEPYDSYGLFTHFKRFTFVSSIILFIWAVTRRRGIAIFLLSIVFLPPLVFGTGTAIYSHGLWMSSIISLLAAPFVYSTLFNEKGISNSSLLALFAIIVTVALGKISSGLMLGCLVGTVVWAREFKRAQAYVFGMALLIFFYIYGALYSEAAGKEIVSLSNVSLAGLGHYYLRGEVYANAIVLTKPILAMLTILATIFCLAANRITGSALLASIVSAFALYFVCAAKTKLSSSDIWFFQYGLSSELLLMTYFVLIRYQNAALHKMKSIVLRLAQVAVFNHSSKMHSAVSGVKVKSAANIIFNVLVFTYLAFFLQNNFTVRGYNLFNCAQFNINNLRTCTNDRVWAGIHALNKNAFSSINDRLPESLQLSLDRLYINGPENLKDKAFTQLYASRPLYELRQNLYEQLSKNHIAKKNVALFIPRSILEDFPNKFLGDTWDQGLLIYAVTGIQLVHGVEKNTFLGYGFAKYVNDPDAYRVNKEELSIDKNCKSIENLSYIAVLDQLSPPQISMVPCRSETRADIRATIGGR